MAKLNKQMAKQVEEAEDGFALMEDGIYHFRLRDVDPTQEGPKGPYWVWEYECVEPPYVNRRQWNNTSLSEASRGIFKATFKAFGVPVDTDTDEMIGSIVRLVIGHRTIQSGNREGEAANQVERVLPKSEDFELPEELKEKEDKVEIF